MKILRFLLIFIGILIVGFLILCIAAPKETNLERSISIKAPTYAVWEQMVYFKNWPNWSPWQEADPTIKVTVSGIDGSPGSSYSWTSENSGEGSVTNKSVDGMQMNFGMHFIKPFEATPDGYVKVEDEGNGMTKATWTFHGKNTFFSGGMMTLMEMLGMGLSKSYERGLQLLKDYAEKNPSPESGLNVQEVQFPGHTYATIRKVLSTHQDSMMKFFSDSYSALGQSAGSRISGPASCLAYNWDEANKKADLAAAFPVSGSEEVKGAAMVTVAPSSAYLITYTGPYDNLMQAHETLGMHLSRTGKTQSMVIEEYIKGPGEEKDPSKWVTNIYYLVQ